MLGGPKVQVSRASLPRLLPQARTPPATNTILPPSLATPHLPPRQPPVESPAPSGLRSILWPLGPPPDLHDFISRPAMIEIRNLSKHFGSLKAVDDVSFSVAKGEVLGFLGPNGAGKSTTMKMVTGFLTPSSGTVLVGGFDVQKQPLAVKSSIGYLPEGAPLYGDMTPLGILKFVAEVRSIPSAERAARIDEVVQKVHIEGVMQQRIDTLSKGFKRRVGLALALVHDPAVLVLDEPTDGLDPNQKHDVRQLIREMAKDKCIVLSTHILEEVPAVCTRAILIADGKLKFDGTPDEMQRMSRRHNAVALTVRTGGGHDLETLRTIQGVQAVEAVDSAPDGCESYLLFPEQGASILSPLSQMAHDENWEVDHLTVQEGRLDDVFRQITTTTTAGA